MNELFVTSQRLFRVRRALGDIKNTYDPTNQANIAGKENGPAKKSSVVLEQANRAAQVVNTRRSEYSPLPRFNMTWVPFLP